MKRYIVKAILIMCAKIFFTTASIGGAILYIGYVKHWNTMIAYSNAFFLAGSLVIIAGGMSRAAAGDDWNIFQRLSAESFREMSSGDRANFIIEASSSISTLILGVASGLLLMLISAITGFLL